MPLAQPLTAMLGVELWRVDLDAPIDDALRADLEPEELARAARFAFERDRRRYLNGRHALRVLLGQRLSQPARDIRILANVYGKPDLATPSEWAFNVTHSQGLGVIALLRLPSEPWQTVGVDFEVGPAPADAQELAKAAFDPVDARSLAAVTDTVEHGAAFWRGWTRREAALKAIGTGFGRDDLRLITTLDNRPIPVEASVGEAHWQLMIESRTEAGLGTLAVALGRRQSPSEVSSR